MISSKQIFFSFLKKISIFSNQQILLIFTIYFASSQAKFIPIPIKIPIPYPVTKTIEVEKPVEIIRNVPVEVIKEVQVIKHVPYEVIKEVQVIKHVPVYRDRLVQVPVPHHILVPYSTEQVHVRQETSGLLRKQILGRAQQVIGLKNGLYKTISGLQNGVHQQILGAHQKVLSLKKGIQTKVGSVLIAKNHSVL